MKILPRELRFRAVGAFGRGLVGALFATVEIERVGTDNFLDRRRRGERVVFVFWHDQLLPLVHIHRNEGATVLVSRHTDGEYISRVMERHGYRTARGSSTRGGARGLRELVRASRNGGDLALTPDGPRGPRHEFKEGALVVAQLTGLPLVPIGLAASAAWILDSWDRFLVPRPFSSLKVIYGPPRFVPRDAGEEARSKIALELQDVLRELTDTAQRDVGASAGPTTPDADPSAHGPDETFDA